MTGTKTGWELHRHIEQLAAAFGVAVCWNRAQSVAASAAMTIDRVLYLHPVEDHFCYAVALHELGHCVEPFGNFPEARREAIKTQDLVRFARVCHEAEDIAWAWAHHYALEWTASMTLAEDFGKSSYAEAVANPELLRELLK